MTDQKKRKRGIHTAVVLEPEVLERLRKSKEGVSFEIRERIRRTLEQDTFDGRTLKSSEPYDAGGRGHKTPHRHALARNQERPPGDCGRL